MTLEAPRTINHALFGYSEGHRQLASTLRLPSEDMYHLGAASDLASDVRLDPEESYLTGLPLAESRQYALIRTWAAPEMPRPGCVWSHVLLLDDGILSTQPDMLVFFSLFRNPRNVDRGFYSEPLLLSAEGPTAAPSLAPQADLIAEIIGSYYSNKPTHLSATAGNDAIEAAIAAVWSQQWSKLRAEFSFRTAQLGSHRRRSTRYDVQVAFSERSDAIVRSDWIDAATDDASAGKVTPLRRFLWRYGRDVRNPRDRFRLLVQTYLASIEARPLSMTAAIKVFDEFTERDEGAILKNDILGVHTTTLSICPSVSFLDMLRLLSRQASNDSVDINEIGRRFEKLSSDEIVDVLNFASSEGSRLDRLRAPIFEWTVRYANDEVVNAQISSDLRTRILMQRPDLITPRAVSDLQSVDLVRLLGSCEAPEAKRIILDAAVRRDPGETAFELLSQIPSLIAASAIAAARAGELHTAWRRPIAAFRNKLLDTDLLQHATGLADVMTIARLFSNLPHNVFPIGQTSANWASRWRVLERDASEQDVLDIEAELLSSALREASPASWDLIAAVLPELRRSIINRPLDGDARQTLDGCLPTLGYNNWDLNRRILLALHSLQKHVPASGETLSTTGLSDAEVYFVFVGPQPEPKSGFFWWL